MKNFQSYMKAQIPSKRAYTVKSNNNRLIKTVWKEVRAGRRSIEGRQYNQGQHNQGFSKPRS